MATIEDTTKYILTLSYDEALVLKVALQFIAETDAPGAQSGEMDHDSLLAVFEALDEVI